MAHVATDLAVSVEGLNISIRHPARKLVHDLSFQVRAGETFGILGESGSGKSLTLRSLVGGLDSRHFIQEGRIEVLGISCGASRGERRDVPAGAGVGLVYQEPSAALDPVYTIGFQMIEALRVAQALDRAASAARVARALQEVRFPDPERTMASYPHELSGGQKQRVVIALALLNNPRVLLADEPTTALDVTTQAQLLRLLKRIQRDREMAIILVSHDIGVVAEMCDRTAVMHQGRIVEQGDVVQVLKHPSHAYTRELLQARRALGFAA
jgi:ABC-type glutathione transport system ATPase component